MSRDRVVLEWVSYESTEKFTGNLYLIIAFYDCLRHFKRSIA